MTFPVISFQLATMSEVNKEDVKQGKLIGKGFSQRIYKCKYRKNKYALKIMDVDTDQEKERAKKEVKLMKKISHPCIIKSFGKWKEEKAVCVIVDRCQPLESYTKQVCLFFKYYY